MAHKPPIHWIKTIWRSTIQSVKWAYPNRHCLSLDLSREYLTYLSYPSRSLKHVKCNLLQKNPLHYQTFIHEKRNFMTAWSENLLSLNNTERVELFRISTDVKAIKHAATLAAKILSVGQVIAVPTDTVYGLAAMVQHSAAVDQLYSIKGRNPDKPISICVSEIRDIDDWAEVTVSNELLHQLLPGPVTLCFKRKPRLNSNFNPEAQLVGIRIPDHLFIRELCNKIQELESSCLPIALTSANLSQSKSCLEVNEFSKELSSRPGSIMGIFDGGRLGETDQSRLGSTVIDLSSIGQYRIIRKGSYLQNTVSILQKNGLVTAK